MPNPRQTSRVHRRCAPHSKGKRAWWRPQGHSVAVLRKHGNRHEIDAVRDKSPDLLRRGFAVDASRLGFAEVDSPRFLREPVADIVGILTDLPGQCPELGQCLTLRLTHGERNLFLLRTGRDCRRHQRLVHLARTTGRAIDEPTLLLRLEIIVGAEPAFKFVLTLTDERKANHDAAPLIFSPPALATANSRAFFRLGILRRAASTSAVSIVAVMTPGSSCPASARIRPHGSTMIEWPKVSRPSSCLPPCAAATTKAPFSMALALSNTCQCASPVWRVKAAGTESTSAPASASARKSCGKRRS